MNEIVYCKKISFDDGRGESISTILGIIKEEDEQFVVIKTGKGNTYRLSRDSIKSIIDTNREFKEEK